MEPLLVQLLIGIIVFGVLFTILLLVLPQLGLPLWVTQAVRIILAGIFLIWLIYLLFPLMHRAF
jgi:prepilin signal peptidase PulO-like enzyme (type II secretory pathway)